MFHNQLVFMGPYWCFLTFCKRFLVCVLYVYVFMHATEPTCVLYETVTAGSQQSGQSAEWTRCSVSRTGAVATRRACVEEASRAERSTVCRPVWTHPPTSAHSGVEKVNTSQHAPAHTHTHTHCILLALGQGQH